MEEKKETIYRFNGDEALQKTSPGKAFYLVTEDVASGKSKKVFMPILVLDVHISGVQNGSTYMLSFAKKRRMLIRD